MTLQAGTAVNDVSPQKPMFLVGYPHVERTSTGIHDPLLASALYLKNDDSAIILVAVDILFFDPPTTREIRKKVSEKTGVPETNVFISCSHTHSGPVTASMLSWKTDPVVPAVDPEYLELIKNGIVSAAIEASKNLRTSQIAWTSAQVDGVGCNRCDPEGPRDSEVGILVVKDTETGNFSALSTTYCMHPTVLHEDSTLVSSDFPYYTRLHLVEKLNRELTVLYHTGPEGNQSPRYHVKGQTFEEAERLGRRLGEFIYQAVSALKDADFSSSIELAGAISEVTLPTKEMPSLEEAEKIHRASVEHYEKLKRENAGHGPVRTAECTTFGTEECVTLAKAQESGELSNLLKKYSPVDVQVLKIGNTFMAGFPGETFIEYGLELKKRIKEKVIVACLVNGELQGYIVTAEAAAAGGYEAGNAVFKPESGNIIVDAAEKLINSLK